MNDDIFIRTRALIGEEGLEKLKKSTVCIFGAGGVGSYAIEALARAGIGRLVITDHARVDPSNINRQIIALKSTVSRFKTDVCRERINDINSSIEVITHREFVTEDNIGSIIPSGCSFIIDAIDSVKSKIAIAVYGERNNIPIISCMGTGNKLDPSRFKVADIYTTSVCPLAKVMRRELKKIGQKKLMVVYSDEEPKESGEDFIASISFVPATAGLRLAAYVVNKLIEAQSSGNVI
jgi:tRNA threonylcarbamoyladenosine dehydratase